MTVGIRHDIEKDGMTPTAQKIDIFSGVGIN